MGFLTSQNKAECYGCEACIQVCRHQAIEMKEDAEGFRYPSVLPDACVQCGLCKKVCPYDRPMPENHCEKYAFGGYHKDADVRFESTSGGAFSAIADAFCDENYVIFGAEASALDVFHSYITDKTELKKFRKSKYSQSVIGDAYIQAKKFLTEGKKVLFSGTPCQISGLLAYLGNTEQELLLTVEVICEGVPSPLYMRKYANHLEKKYKQRLTTLDYRYTGNSMLKNGKWDFEQMRADFDGGKVFIRDRWFNPFWSIWLGHLMSRPSCYECRYASTNREADISLGDLWGVHLYCPELYGKNGGSSLIVCNSEKGAQVCRSAEKNLFGHELAFRDALKYQSPMRQHISSNPQRDAFMQDLMSDAFDYRKLTKKWAKRPGIKLLAQKYVWGNRQKVWLWNKKHKSHPTKDDTKNED